MTSISSSSSASSTSSVTQAPAARWTGRILFGLTVAFMLMDSAFKFMPASQPVIDSFMQLGYDPAVAPVIGVLSLTCTVLYAWPRTAAWGALLLTGYLGGAVATHFRVGNPLASHTLFPIYIALLAWGGLYFRDARVRQLFSFRTGGSDRA